MNADIVELERQRGLKRAALEMTMFDGSWSQSPPNKGNFNACNFFIFFSWFQGVVSGVTGIVTKPVEGNSNLC